MKTPMQELIEIIKKRQEDNDAIPFMYNDKIIELAESMLEKEKDTFIDFGDKISYLNYGDKNDSNLVWNETFNTKK